MTRQQTSSNLTQMRRNAKRVARDQGIAHSKALDVVANEYGYANWALLVKNAPAPEAVDTTPALRPASREEVRQALGLPRMDALHQELLVIRDIVKRFADIVGDDIEVDRLSLMMDLEACHCNGCPLDLVSLLEASRDSDLVHDVAGIRRYLNRETGKLEEFFRPRYASEHGSFLPAR